MIVNNGNWVQAMVPAGTVGIRTAASILRRIGYKVSVSSIGKQVTPEGVVTITLINVMPGQNTDTIAVTDILKSHIPELR